MKKIDVSNVDNIYIDEPDSKKVNKNSTISVSVENINKLKAVSQIFELGSMNDAVEKVLSLAEPQFSNNQIEQYKLLLKLFNKDFSD